MRIFDFVSALGSIAASGMFIAFGNLSPNLWPSLGCYGLAVAFAFFAIFYALLLFGVIVRERVY